MRLLKLIAPIGLFAALFFAPQVAKANQSAQVTYCTPPNVFVTGTIIQAQPVNQNFLYGAQCGTQYGDLFSDGPLYTPNPSFTGFNFTVPANVWIINGTRLGIAAIAQTAPASSTTYWWLSATTGILTCTLDNANPPQLPCSGFNLPDSSSKIEYTITTNGSGITSITEPTLAGIIFNGVLSLASLPANSCLQTGTNGAIQATGFTCGTGSAGVAAVVATGNITANTVSGTTTVTEVNNPTWTGTPTIASDTTAGQLDFGSDGTAFLARSGLTSFTFTAGTSAGATVAAGGGFTSGSSTYGPTSAFVNGGLTASSLTASGLTPNECVQTGAGGQLTTIANGCLTGSTITSIVAGASGNITASTVSGTTTIDIVNGPTFSGTVAAGQFTGSGAGLTAGSVPNTALATNPVVSIGAGTAINVSCPSCVTPTVSVASNPTFTGNAAAGSFQATGNLVAGSATAVIPSNSDLSASRSTSTGAMYLGGTSSSCLTDYGVTTASTETIGCALALGSGFSMSASAFNIAGTNLSGCGFCAGSAQTNDVIAWNAGGVLGNVTVGSTNSTCTSGAIPGTGLALTSSVNGLVICLDNAGSGGFVGDVTVGHSLRSIREVVAGYNTATTITSGNYGDVEASRTASTGNLNLGGTMSSCNLDYGVTTSSLDTFGCPVAVPKLLQAATNDYAGTCTNSSSTTCTATLAAAFTSTPICLVQDQTSTNRVNAECAASGTTLTVTTTQTAFFGSCTMSTTTCTITAPYTFTSTNSCLAQGGTGILGVCSLSGTTITVTAASSNANTWHVILIGVPSATTHVFQYVLIGNPN